MVFKKEKRGKQAEQNIIILYFIYVFVIGYFHGAGEGHKMDAIKNCDKASFCVYDEGYAK